ncbi:MAG: hypothetical protein DDT21_00113 [Syntrophomonadaceae bacterium]|nr:hypothetical protein [Bacillota bacterium]
MPQTCRVCKHKRVEEINRELLEGETLRNIAEKFSTSTTALHRHKTEHIPASMVLSQGAREAARADTLLEQVSALRDKAVSILVAAERAGDLRTALLGIREAKGCLELLARISGELTPERILVQAGPVIDQIIFVLRQEIRDPEALQRVSQRLLLEAGGHEGGSGDHA